MDIAELQPFDRQPDETAKAYAAFVQYRDLGAERSLEKTRQALGKTRGYSHQLEVWSSKYQWSARALAWDMYRQQQRDRAIISEDTALLESELAAYNALHERWQQAFDATPAVISTKRGTQKANTNALLALARLRWQLDNIARRALGLPERVKESRLTGGQGEDVSFTFVEVAHPALSQLSNAEIDELLRLAGWENKRRSDDDIPLLPEEIEYEE